MATMNVPHALTRSLGREQVLDAAVSRMLSRGQGLPRADLLHSWLATTLVLELVGRFIYGCLLAAILFVLLELWVSLMGDLVVGLDSPLRRAALVAKDLGVTILALHSVDRVEVQLVLVVRMVKHSVREFLVEFQNSNC